MQLDGQMTFNDVDPEYKAFVDKFKPKKTTDDCYTPENIYQTVLDWCVEEYDIDRNNIVRPFWPGGNYLEHEYPEGCAVVDNPPFSIISQIVRNYNAAGIKYFLFAPYLTNLSTGDACCHIVTASSITYENGADIGTSFVTNLDNYRLRSCPELAKRIKAANAENLKAMKKQMPKYQYPCEVITAAALGYLAVHGEELKILPEDCYFVRGIDSQKATGKALFGAGYLLSERAAAERAAAERAAAERAAATKWTLSEREQAIIRQLGRAK